LLILQIGVILFFKIKGEKMNSETPHFLLLILPLIAMIVAFLVTVFLVILPLWRICKKAGFHGALSLLMLVPLGNICLLFFLAFAEWPALKNEKQRQENFEPVTGDNVSMEQL
jgi:hypothetical protein